MNRNRLHAIAALVVALFLTVALAPALPAQSEEDTDASVSGTVDEEGVELSFEVTDDDEAAAAPAGDQPSWFEEPLVIAAIVLGVVSLVVLAALAMRGGRRTTTA